jgi:hypothetical protein
MLEVKDELDGRVVFFCNVEVKSAMAYKAISVPPRRSEFCTFQMQNGAGLGAVEFIGIVRRVEHIT